MIERQAHAGVYDCMDELSASQIRALSEMLAAHSRDDLEWRKRNDETLRKRTTSASGSRIGLCVPCASPQMADHD